MAFLCAADNGRVLCFPLSELKTLSKGRGLMLMQLAAGERLCAMALLSMETTAIPNSDGSNSQHIIALQTVKAAGITVRGRVFEDKIDALTYVNKRGKRGKTAPISGVIHAFLLL
jgi:DNA gyrase/topoisomerase IV subunit A